MKLLLPLFALAPAMLAADVPAVAILAAVDGKVTVAAPRAHAAPARVFDWLSDGTAIETGAAARAVVVLANGDRFQMGERSRAILTDGSLRRSSGTLQPLPGITELPKLTAIAAGDASSRGGVVRIRGARLQHCYPAADARVPAGDVTLSFEPTGAGSSYLVTVENQSGTVVQRMEVSGPTVRLPASLLQAGESYSWQAKSKDGMPDAPGCSAEFSVLPADDAARRAALKAAVERSGNANSVALLAAIDRRLGLFREAREEFVSVQDRASAPDAIREAIRQIDELLR